MYGSQSDWSFLITLFFGLIIGLPTLMVMSFFELSFWYDLLALGVSLFVGSWIKNYLE